jgi:hypothetical protein
MTPIFFMHVPKTAGRTLLHLIQPHFDPADVLYVDWPDITPRVNPVFRLIAGHLYLRDVPLRALCHHYRITILRDPMEQAISHYYHLNERKARFGKLQDYLQHALDVGISASIMDGSFERTLDTATDHLSSFSKANASLEENCGSAKTNLRYFDAIGFMEDYDPFIFALGAKLGFEVTEVPRINPPKWKPDVIEITDEARDKLRRMLEHDYWFYNYARRTFAPFKV